MVQPSGLEEGEALQREDVVNTEGDVSRRDVKEDQEWGKTFECCLKLRF